MATLRTATMALAISLSLGACAPGGTLKSDGPAPERATTVRVTNHNWMDMAVYLVDGGMRYRLGTVTTTSTQVFPMPRNAQLRSGRVLVMADPVGSSETFTTDPLQVRPGQEIEVTLENHLAVSSFAVWDR